MLKTNGEINYEIMTSWLLDNALYQLCHQVHLVMMVLANESTTAGGEAVSPFGCMMSSSGNISFGHLGQRTPCQRYRFVRTASYSVFTQPWQPGRLEPAPLAGSAAWTTGCALAPQSRVEEF
ncbi:uncharacterized protein LOC144007829 [Festucalex cinctus]